MLRTSRRTQPGRWAVANREVAKHLLRDADTLSPALVAAFANLGNADRVILDAILLDAEYGKIGLAEMALAFARLC